MSAPVAQGGREVAWRVPVLQSPFGERLDHGVRDGLVLVMHRGAHGWKAAGQGHALLAHQLYVKNVEPLCAASHEVAVVGLSGGGWRTVWARSDDDVTHPAPPSAPVGVDMERFREPVVLWGKAYEYDRHGREAVVERRKPIVDELLAIIDAAAQQPAAAEPKTLPVPTRVYLTDKAAVIVGGPQRGWDEEGPEAHNCDDMGCSTIGPHVLARVPFTDERALSQQPEAQQPAAVDGPYRTVDGVVTVNGIALDEAVKLGDRYAATIEKRGMPRAAQVLEALVMIGRHALAAQHQEPKS